MAITFNNIPSALRSDGSYIEIGNTDARASTHTQRALIIFSGSFTPLYELTGIDTSVLYREFRRNNPTMPLYGIRGGITDIITAIAGEQFDYIVFPYSSVEHITKMTDELEARWHAGIPGMLFVAGGNDYTTAKTFGESLNSPHVTALSPLDSSTSNAIWAAAYCGAVSKQLTIDPNVSLHGLAIKGVELPTTELTLDKKSTLLKSGLSVYDIENGEVRINSAVTGYTEDRYKYIYLTKGYKRHARYLYVNTVAVLTEIRRRQAAHYELQFANHLLAEDGMGTAQGVAVVTPSIWKAELIKLYRDFESRDWVHDVETYAESIICEINADDPKRLEYSDEPILARQFRVLAGQLQFN